MAAQSGNPKKIALRCLAAAGAAVLLALIAIGLFNALIDPLAMFKFVDLPTLNRHKPAIYPRARIAKAYEVRRIAPTGVIIGSSRTHLGLRPSHEGWAPKATPRYNLGFDGATIKEMYLYLRHAQSVAPLKQVVLGLDTWQLIDGPAGTRPGFDADVLFADASLWSRLRVALADLRLLISFDTLQLSIQTLRIQEWAEPEWYAPDGQRLGEVYFRRPGEMFREKSPRAYFEHYDREEISWQKEPPEKPGTAQPPDAKTTAPAEATSMDYMKRIIEFCREHDIDLRIFTTPSHARNQEIIAAAGSWAKIESGKRKLTEILARDAAAHRGKRDIPFYDFADYSSITTEALPPETGRLEMRNYWDSSHFKESVGDLVLDRLYGLNAPGRVVPSDFGVRVTASNIESHLAAIRQRQAEYRASHAEDVEALAALLEQARRSAH